MQTCMTSNERFENQESLIINHCLNTTVTVLLTAYNFKILFTNLLRAMTNTSNKKLSALSSRQDFVY